jgi:quercetin dioxygenase-like cupin family protein
LHRHRGDEYGLVLSGALREDLHGRVGFPGDLLHMPEGSTHTVTCVSKESCIFAVLLKGGMPLILSESAPLP